MILLRLIVNWQFTQEVLNDLVTFPIPGCLFELLEQGSEIARDRRCLDAKQVWKDCGTNFGAFAPKLLVNFLSRAYSHYLYLYISTWG